MLKTFDSNIPVWEQLKRCDTRFKRGRKHMHKVGPTRAKNQPSKDTKRAAAWRKYHEQVALYFQGHRDTFPSKP